MVNIIKATRLLIQPLAKMVIPSTLNSTLRLMTLTSLSTYLDHSLADMHPQMLLLSGCVVMMKELSCPFKTDSLKAPSFSFSFEHLLIRLATIDH